MKRIRILTALLFSLTLVSMAGAQEPIHIDDFETGNLIRWEQPAMRDVLFLPMLHWYCDDKCEYIAGEIMFYPEDAGAAIIIPVQAACAWDYPCHVWFHTGVIYNVRVLFVPLWVVGGGTWIILMEEL